MVNSGGAVPMACSIFIEKIFFRSSGRRWKILSNQTGERQSALNYETPFDKLKKIADLLPEL
jgi:hypothetical protein